MSQSATPATRIEDTRRYFCRTRQRHGHTALTWTVADGCEWQTVASGNGCERLRTVANGCERCGWLGTVADGCAPFGKHIVNPQTVRVKPEPLLRIGENTDFQAKTLFVFIVAK